MSNENERNKLRQGTLAKSLSNQIEATSYQIVEFANLKTSCRVRKAQIHFELCFFDRDIYVHKNGAIELFLLFLANHQSV